VREVEVCSEICTHFFQIDVSNLMAPIRITIERMSNKDTNGDLLVVPTPTTVNITVRFLPKSLQVWDTDTAMDTDMYMDSDKAKDKEKGRGKDRAHGHEQGQGHGHRHGLGHGHGRGQGQGHGQRQGRGHGQGKKTRTKTETETRTWKATPTLKMSKKLANSDQLGRVSDPFKQISTGHQTPLIKFPRSLIPF
jgi:hypothetical protein